MEEELRRIGISLGEKALHIFVLTNDLRRHLHEYFNRLPRTRVELLLPFYDRRVIESVLRIPPPLEAPDEARLLLPHPRPPPQV